MRVLTIPSQCCSLHNQFARKSANVYKQYLPENEIDAIKLVK